MIPKIERLSRVNELQGFPYGLKHVAAPFWLLLSSENRPCILELNTAYRGCLAWATQIKYSKIFLSWFGYGVSDFLDMAYWAPPVRCIGILGYSVLSSSEEGGSNKTKVTPDNVEKPTETETETPVINEVENGAKLIKTSENEEAVEAPGSQPVAYYLKHKINEKLIKGLVNNNRFNNSRSRTQAGKKKGKEYKVLPGGPAYDAILKKMITKKEDIGGNFEIPCSLGNLKHVNALVDQGSDVNVMPYSTYTKLTDEKPAETDIRLSLASHSYIYPLGIAEDVLVEIAEHVYPIDFVILDIRENENRPFILGTPFLTTAKASIKFDTGTITLRSGKHKVSFHRKPDSSNMIDKGVKNDIEPIAPTMTVNRLVLEWEEKIKLHLEREMQFNQWRSKNFKGMHPTLIATKEEEEDEGEVT
ncbi:MAK10-like protein [Tanacetum coccineum]